MKFKSNTRRRAIEYEKDWVERWKQNKTFEKSVENRPADNAYIFYDGPPFITGVPHHGTLLSSVVKDAVPRYQTMKGKRVERVWGWDCHGLPAERYTEKKLGIQSREEVIEYGVEKYILACRDNMAQTSSEWEDVVDRVGRWVDFKGAYKTMDKDYMESVWWAFKTLHEKGKIYEGEKVLMYCTLDATPLSKAEVTMDSGAYQDVTDPSVYVKFKLTSDSRDNFLESLHKTTEKMLDAEAEAQADMLEQADLQAWINEYIQNGDDIYLLAWSTTPWTLPANTALAVSPDVEYVLIKHNGMILVAAKSLAGHVMTDKKHKPLDFEESHEFTGKKLVGLEYEPLIGESRGKNAHKVWAADYVSTESGTGVVHIAPAYGEEDFELARKHNLPVVHVIDENGYFTEGPWTGKNIWEINKQIAKDMHGVANSNAPSDAAPSSHDKQAEPWRESVWKIDYIRHSYPHCHRCGTRLMYRAHPSWFMDIDGQRELMLEKNGPINWFPPHVKHGRFEKTVLQAPDWNISRDRFWATAMPVWKGVDSDGKEHVKVIGSYAELKQLSGVELKDYHRPWVDEITFEIDGVNYQRIDKVMDSWFEAGSMPFAQFHYPFENKEKFETNFPGDFIVEYIGQVRAWFYYMHAMSVALFGENSFKNVIVTGNVAGNDGRKMSKSYGNYTDPNELMDKFSADSLRFLLLSSPLLNGEDFSLQDKEVGDVARKLSMIWNMYDFFTLYAEADNWEYDGELKDPLADCQNPLDIWIISRLHQLVGEVEKHMDEYNIPDALSPVIPFLDDASNWYVRRSRRRFWKSEDDADKQLAYKTLHYVLVRLAYLLAPFTPFLAEELYHKLTGDEQSIHLKDWLPAGPINELAINDMSWLRSVINEGLSQRAAAGMKVRQPLASVSVFDENNRLNKEMKEVIAEELNVKQVMTRKDLMVDNMSPLLDRYLAKMTAQPVAILDMELTDELKREGLMREVVRNVQNARKQAELQVDDRIKLSLSSDDSELARAISEHSDTIASEVLATSLELSPQQYDFVSEAAVEGKNLLIELEKADSKRY